MNDKEWVSVTPEEFLDKINKHVKDELDGAERDPDPREFGSVLTVTNGKGETFDISVDLGEWPSIVAKHVSTRLVPEWLGHFLAKNAGYGEMHKDLGVKAQYIDIHRKTNKLKRAFWDNKDIGSETPREVLMDLIGHCFLTISLLDEGETE